MFKKFWQSMYVPTTDEILSKCDGISLTRSGMALSAKQMYDKVMSGQGSTAIVSPGHFDEHGDDFDSYPADEQDLVTAFTQVQQAQKKQRDKLDEAVKSISKNDKKGKAQSGAEEDPESDS